MEMPQASRPGKPAGAGLCSIDHACVETTCACIWSGPSAAHARACNPFSIGGCAPHMHAHLLNWISPHGGVNIFVRLDR
jgi:hypothetical protein